ncbi:hypothetical protein [Staphylococcus pasteuri]|uniref:hypothetical protein n=1 Tax=Staphylococcus pasteuri TaxID=45972 RepID=UPI0036CD0DE1
MTVTLSQESYDAILDDLKKLRERNAVLERKAQAFYKMALTVLSEDNDVIKNMNNIVTKIVINNLERGE